MGTYVYALNTKVHTLSNVTVGVAEYRYKPTYGFGGEEQNARWFTRLCKRRVAHFDTHKLPFFFVMNKLAEGTHVYSHLTKDGHLVGSCFSDSIQFNKVGVLTKVGRSWTIKWD